MSEESDTCKQVEEDAIEDLELKDEAAAGAANLSYPLQTL